MLDILAENTFLTLFAVIALGAALGAVPFGPVKFGAAGALFVGLLVGAIIPEPSGDLVALQNLGLGLFVYLVGLEAGETFFKEIKNQFSLMIAAVVAIAIGAAAAILAGGLLGVVRELTVGVFAGALTNTPSLALAQEQTGSELPAVGYSLGYPTGVVVAILLVSVFVGRRWKASKDQLDADQAILEVARIEVQRPVTAQEVFEIRDQALVSTVRRDNRTTVMAQEVEARPGDVLTVFASKSAMPRVVEELGKRVPRRLLRDQNVGLHRFLISNRDIAGNSVSDLELFDRFSSRITRIRRVDQEILATSDERLEVGDIVEVAHPVKQLDALTAYFGNSVRNMSEVDVVAAAGGLALGYAAGLIVVPLPGGASFALGSAAGPLIVGLILGAVSGGRGIQWQLPRPANYTLRQFGLMLFLAAVGIASGPAFASTALTLNGLISVLIAVIVSVCTCGSMYLMLWLMGRSATRATGAVAGLLGQPAVLQFALSRSTDQRIMMAYSTVITVAVLFKIIVIPLMLAV